MNNENSAGFTETQVAAAARAMADQSATICNVDKDDNWKYHGEAFMSDARLVLEAAAKFDQPQGAGSARQGGNTSAETDLDAYESLCQDKDATIAALNQQLAAARNALEGVVKHADGPAYKIANEAIRALASHPAAPVQPTEYREATTELSLPELAEQFAAVAALGGKYTLSSGVCAKLYAAMTAPPVQQTGDVRDPLAEFTAYVVKNYPADTIIGDPAWHAPRLFRAAQQALAASGGAHAVPDGWQPISTAPEDRTIDILMPNGTRWAGVYHDRICNEWRRVTETGHMLRVPRDYPTHWHAIPAAPTQDQGEGK